MKPSLPRFIYFSEGDGQFILCTEYPFVVGQVWKFTSNEEFEKKAGELIQTLILFRVEGYNVMIANIGNLAGKPEIGIYNDTTCYAIHKEMTSHFLSRINERPKRWERYKIK